MSLSSKAKILILNGPNLNLLGSRQPEIYGSQTLSDIETDCRKLADSLGVEVICFQSNSEGALVDRIQSARGDCSAVIINPGAYSHTSIAILDALLACDLPVYEVHLSNIHRRESFRNHSFVSKAAKGVLCGFGAEGYAMAIRAAVQDLSGV